MKRILVPLLLCMLMLVSCVAPETEFPTQVQATPILTLPAIVAEVQFIGDGGLISDQPCISPCFYGVRIGETKLDRVVPILENNGIFACVHDTPTTILCGNKIVVGVNSSTNLVDAIGYYPDSVISIGELILKYGIPNIVHVIPSGIPEAPTTDMLLFFDVWGMMIRLPTADGTDYILSGSSEVELVNYFDDILYSEISKNVFSQSWNGYGTYHSDLDR